jgi:hypothetical protein
VAATVAGEAGVTAVAEAGVEDADAAGVAVPGDTGEVATAGLPIIEELLVTEPLAAGADDVAGMGGVAGSASRSPKAGSPPAWTAGSCWSNLIRIPDRVTGPAAAGKGASRKCQPLFNRVWGVKPKRATRPELSGVPQGVKDELAARPVASTHSAVNVTPCS